MKHWRLKTWPGDPRAKNTPNEGKLLIGWYCLKHSVGAMGWCLRNLQSQIQGGKIKVDNLSDYKRLVRQTEPDTWTENLLKSVYYLDPMFSNGVKIDDLIWMYHEDGDYYIARVEENSRYYYNADDEAYDNDACNQLTNLHWIKVDKSIIHPGITQALRHRGNTFCPIYSYQGESLPSKISQRIYNEITGTNYYWI